MAVCSIEEEARARKICDGFIRKPFNRAELVAELSRFLKSSRVGAMTESAAAGATPIVEAAVSAGALAKRPGLLEKLHAQERTVWPALCKTKATDEIELFAQRLKQWAEEGEWRALRDYADCLDQQVQAFDLSRLPKTLQSFPTVIRTLP